MAVQTMFDPSTTGVHSLSEVSLDRARSHSHSLSLSVIRCRLGGPMKCTASGTIWCHLTCALWLPEIKFVDYVKMVGDALTVGLPQAIVSVSLSNRSLCCIWIRSRMRAGRFVALFVQHWTAPACNAHTRIAAHLSTYVSDATPTRVRELDMIK